MNSKTFLAVKPNIGNFSCALVSGILLIIAWPPHRAGFLLCIAFVPFIYALDHTAKQKQVFLFSLTNALLWAVGTMYWEAQITTTHANLKLFFFIPAFIVFALLMTIPWLIWKRLSKYLSNYLWWLSLPLLWTAYEFLTGKGDLAMTWLNLEFGLSYYPNLIRFSQFAGPHGVAFLIMSVNVLVYLIIKNRKNTVKLKIPFALLGVIVSGILLSDLTTGKGVTGKESITKKVAVIQPDWLSYYTPDKNAFQDEVDTLKKLTLPLAGQHPDLIVCSEGFIHHQSAETHPILMERIDEDTVIMQLKALSATLNAPIITGIELAGVYASSSRPTLTAQYIRPGYYYDTYNAAVLIPPKGDVQIYVKNKLCPFIERVPFLELISIFNGADSAINNKIISYGTMQANTVFQYADMRIAPAICWENSFPDYMAETLRKNNANMVVVVSSNFSLGKTAAEIDAAYSIPLAVKMQLPLVRCANTGISCFIDKNGKVQQASGWDESKVLVQDVELNSYSTFYIKYGDIAGRFSFYASLILILYALFRKIANRLSSKEAAPAKKHAKK